MKKSDYHKFEKIACRKIGETDGRISFLMSPVKIRAYERILILRDLPFKHKGIMCAPFIGVVSIEKYLGNGQIEQNRVTLIG